MDDINSGTLLGGIGLVITALSTLIAALNKAIRKMPEDEEEVQEDDGGPEKLAVLDYRVTKLEKEIEQIKSQRRTRTTSK